VNRASKVLYGHVKQASQYSYFYESDLKDANTLLSLIKKAYELQTKKASLNDSVTRIKSNLSSAVIATKNTLNRAKANMPTKGMVAITAPLYEPKTPVWSNLQKMPE
jgi:predicted RNA-binding protein with EMAP domain